MIFTADLVSIGGTGHYDASAHTLTWLTGDNFAAMLAAQSVTINGHSCTVTGVTSATVLAVTDGSDSTGDYSWSASVKGCQAVLIESVGLYRGIYGPTSPCIVSIILSGIPSALSIFTIGQTLSLNFAYADSSKSYKAIAVPAPYAGTGPFIWGAPYGNLPCVVAAIGPTNVTLTIPNALLSPGTIIEPNSFSYPQWTYAHIHDDYIANPSNYNGAPVSQNGGLNADCNYKMSAYGSGYFYDGSFDIVFNQGGTNPRFQGTGKSVDLFNDGTYYNFLNYPGSCGSFSGLTAPYFSDTSTFDTVANSGGGPSIILTIGNYENLERVPVRGLNRGVF